MALKFDLEKFHSQFPADRSDKAGAAIQYHVQDANFRVYNPDNSDDPSVFKFSMDNNIRLSTDDHVKLEVTFDDRAVIQSVSHEWHQGSVLKIPKAVITLGEISIEVAGAVGAVFTDGADEPAVQEVVADFKEACDTYNKIVGALYSLENTGSTLYMQAAVAQTVIRLSNSVSVA